MKKFSLALIFISLLIGSACGAIEETAFPTVPMREETPTEAPRETAISVEETNLIKSDLERELSPQITSEDLESLAQANNAFAISFYNEIRKQEGNIIFSPLSISLALSMTMVGAKTSTEDAMLEALQMSLSEVDVHPSFNALLLAIEESQEEMSENVDGNQFQLNIANSIWGQSGYDFKEDFLEILALHYGSGLYQVDFIQNPEAARVAINDWVENETQDKIQDLIPPDAIDQLTRLVLANAIYFNGSWLYPFSQTGTEEASFIKLDGSEITVDMMKLYGERLLYYQGNRFQAVRLPYLSSDFAMIVIVPDADTFGEVESGLSPEILTEISENMGSLEVNLQMPKFDFESTIDAKSPLKALGMTEAFSADTADFSGITEFEDLYISDVLHKATITVDEEGTEAAAATAVIVGVESAMPGEPISLIINRPFLFVIQHRPTNSILFMGRVTQP